MTLATIPWRLIALVSLISLAVGFVSFVYGAGAERERLENEAAQAAANASATEVNTATGGAVAEATDNLAAENLRLTREAASARRALDAYSRSTPPPVGTVGADARIDPAIARIGVCSVERLRGSPPSAGCDRPADPANLEP